MKKTPSDWRKIAQNRHSDGKSGISDDNWNFPEDGPQPPDEKK
jgi:hypothetical protein